MRNSIRYKLKEDFVMRYGKLKKAFTLGLTAAMTASLLTGCSSKTMREANLIAREQQ